MSKVKVNVEVDDCNDNDSDQDPNVNPDAVGDLFYMTFAASDNIKTAADVTKTWYINPGNIGTQSWLTWNPMPWAGTLIEIKATMSPAFKSGGATWGIMKNSTPQGSYNDLFFPPGQSKGSRGLDISFGIDDCIGLSLELKDILTDTWPAAVLVFKRT